MTRQQIAWPQLEEYFRSLDIVGVLDDLSEALERIT